MDKNEKILTDASPKEVAEYAVKVLDAKKAGDIKLLKIDKKTVIADYFVICTGNSATQIKSLADELEYKLGEAGAPYIRLEGGASNEWRVLDLKDVIIHIFSREARDFYKLEKLWADAEEINVDEITG